MTDNQPDMPAKEHLIKIITDAWSWASVSKDNPTFGDAMQQAADDIINAGYIRADLCASASDAPTGDLVLCRRVVKPSEHEGDTGYEYFEPVRDYAPTYKERAEALTPDTIAKVQIDKICRMALDEEDGRACEDYLRRALATIQNINMSLTAPDQSETIKQLQDRIADFEKVCGVDNHEYCIVMKSACVDQNKLIKALVEALDEAKSTIKSWHGPVQWKIYDNHSPEMKKINAARTLAGKAGGA